MESRAPAESTRARLLLPSWPINSGISFALDRCIIYKETDGTLNVRRNSLCSFFVGVAVPENLRIIEPDPVEVNRSSEIRIVRRGSRSRVWRLLICLLLALLAPLGCTNDEERAERLYEKAQQEVQEGKLQAAIEIYERIVDRYPGTRTARRAQRQIVLYEGLEDAVRSYPGRMARDLIVRTARAIERYRQRKRTWPSDLNRLVPDYLPEPPVDPWGRDLLYEVKRRRRGYVLACFGEDGEPGGAGDDADWFVEDGSFVMTPPKEFR
jgi:general secretion pathway protein G